MPDNQREWKYKIQKLINTCQGEIKKTTVIGKKMLHATKSNTLLHESYENLGKMLFNAIQNQELNWDDPRVHQLMDTIKKCQSELEMMEKEVQLAKKDHPS